MSGPSLHSRVGRITFILLALLIVVVPPTVTAAPFEPDDVFLGGYEGKIYHYRHGTLVAVLNTGAGSDHTIIGMCFSTSGNYLYATSAVGTISGRVSRFDNHGNLLDGIWGSTFVSQYPSSCVVDASGNVYVGMVTTGTEGPSIRKYGADGGFLAYFYPETDESGYRAIDLDSDQCTLIYTSGGEVRRFDVCRNQQLATLAISPISSPLAGRIRYAVRVRRNGEVLVECSDILRLRSNGQIIRAYEASYYRLDPDDETAPFFAVNLAPDGNTFWAATEQRPFLHGRVNKIEMDSGQWVTYFEHSSFTSVAVYREPTAATTDCSDGIDNDGDGQIDHPQDTSCSSPEDFSERLCWKIGRLWVCLFEVAIASLLLAAGAGAGGGWWLWWRKRKNRT